MVSPFDAKPRKPLPAAAQRALAEAAERKAREQTNLRLKEIAGPKGAEPTRFGDWERRGITYDF